MKPALHRHSPPLLGITGNSAFGTENTLKPLLIRQRPDGIRISLVRTI
jgi:hypothetical protein